MLATGCVRNPVSQVDVHISSDQGKAPGTRLNMEFGDFVFGQFGIMIINKVFGPL